MTDARRNGRALSSLTAGGGGLPLELRRYGHPQRRVSKLTKFQHHSAIIASLTGHQDYLVKAVPSDN